MVGVEGKFPAIQCDEPNKPNKHANSTVAAQPRPIIKLPYEHNRS